MKPYFIAIVLLLASNLSAQEVVSHISLLRPTEEVSTPDLKGLVWHKWNTENFVILSIDKNQGEYLYRNIEATKSWILTRWGLEDIRFSAECRIFCVPDAALLEKLFGVKTPTAQVRRGSDGKIEISVLWLVLGKNPSEVVPGAMTQVCLNELGIKALWLYRGMGILNGTRDQIRKRLSVFRKYLDSNQKMFFSQSLLTMTAADWNKLPDQYKYMYDCQAAAICLIFRQEFGQDALLDFVSSKMSESDLKKCFGFNSYEQFDVTFKRYMYYLSVDIEQDKTPEHYLYIIRKD